MKKNNIYVILLLVLAMAIWSHNAYRIFVGVTQADQELGQRPDAQQWELPDTLSPPEFQPDAFVYQATFRDPFEHWLRQEEKRPQTVGKPQAIKVEKPEPLPPRLRLSGIMRDRTGMLAIIEGPDGETHFLKPQDVMMEVKIISMDSSAVDCEFNKKRFQLFLQP